MFFLMSQATTVIYNPEAVELFVCYFSRRSDFFNNIYRTPKIIPGGLSKRSSSSYPGRSTQVIQGDQKLWKIFSKNTLNFAGGTKYYKNRIFHTTTDKKTRKQVAFSRRKNTTKNIDYYFVGFIP